MTIRHHRWHWCHTKANTIYVFLAHSFNCVKLVTTCDPGVAEKSFSLTSQWLAIITMFLYLWGPGSHIPWCVPINSRCILLAYFDIVREKECAICERKLTKCTKVYARISDKSKWDLSVDDGRVNAFSEKKFLSNNWHILKTCWPTTSLYQPTFEMF